jgi:hypothetical protein
MVLQVVFVFHQLCLHNDVRKFIIQDTEAVAYLVTSKLVSFIRRKVRWKCPVVLRNISVS